MQSGVAIVANPFFQPPLVAHYKLDFSLLPIYFLLLHFYLSIGMETHLT